MAAEFLSVGSDLPRNFIFVEQVGIWIFFFFFFGWEGVDGRKCSMQWYTRLVVKRNVLYIDWMLW